MDAVVEIDPHALRFSGDDCVVAEGRPVDSGDALTLEAWAVVGDLEDRSAAIVTFDDVLALWVDEGRVGLSTPSRVGEDGWWGAVTAWDDEPHHLAATWSAESVAVYVDGQPVAMGDAMDVDRDATGMRIGCGPGGLHFDGVLDEVRISATNRYPDVFEPEPVASPDDADTIALWHFDTGSGTFALEEGDDYPGILQGAEWVPGLVDPK